MKSPALLLLLFSFCLSVPMQAQEASPNPSKGGEKSVTPTPYSILTTPHSTRAVVIGISDYQDKDIPDLRFADKDAEAFANFLRSPAGGGLDNDHLRVLTNDQATAGRIAEALDALIASAKLPHLQAQRTLALRFNVVTYYSRRLCRQPRYGF